MTQQPFRKRRRRRRREGRGGGVDVGKLR